MGKSSPFELIHERIGANFGEYDGWRLPRDYGDPAGERRALQQHCAVFDLSSFGRIRIKGEESSALIDKLMAGQRCRPKLGEWTHAEMSDAEELVRVVRIGKTKAGYIVFTLPEKRMRTLSLVRRAVEQESSGVEIVDLTEKTGMLGIYGPESIKAVTNILPFDIADMAQGEILSLSLFMISVTIVRGSWTGDDGLELLCPAGVAPLAADALTKYQKSYDITPAGMDCLRTAIADIDLEIRRTAKAAGKAQPG